MTRTTSPSARLVQRLKAAFSNPPVKAGMRLNPERELARTLDVSPKCINRTLRLLTEEGILSKRHGSGNYIRRIPGECVPADLKAEQLFPASELEEDAAPHLASLPEQQRLTIQLWSGFHGSVEPPTAAASSRRVTSSTVSTSGRVLAPLGALTAAETSAVTAC